MFCNVRTGAGFGQNLLSRIISYEPICLAICAAVDLSVLHIAEFHLRGQVRRRRTIRLDLRDDFLDAFRLGRILSGQDPDDLDFPQNHDCHRSVCVYGGNHFVRYFLR